VPAENQKLLLKGASRIEKRERGKGKAIGKSQRRQGALGREHCYSMTGNTLLI